MQHVKHTSKRKQHWLRYALVCALAAATALGASSLPSAHAAVNKAGAGREDVETRIRTLHTQLHITPQQEQAWGAVAQIMRDNAQAMKERRNDQAEHERSATAPDMLNAYAQSIDGHAEGIHKFIPAFQKLYDSMSDAQKKNADVVFRGRVHEAAARGKS